MIIPWWGAQFWFPLMLQLLLDFPNSSTTEKEYIVFTIKERVSSSTRCKTKATGSSFITKQSAIGNFHIKLRNLSQTHGEPPQDQVYESVLKRLKFYALSQNENPYITSIEIVLKFIHDMHNHGCLYSSLCAARSALASVVTIKGFAKLSDYPLLVRYLKGIFNRHPPLPRYMNIWDISLVLI